MLDATQIGAIEAAMEAEHAKDREALARLKRFLPNKNGAKNGNSHNQETLQLIHDDPDGADTLIGRVESVLFADPEKRWTVPTMIEHLRSIGVQFEAKRPDATMGLIFSKLKGRYKVRIVKRGSGRRPHVYKAEVNPPGGGQEEHSRN
jgi:hypothetical protein